MIEENNDFLDEIWSRLRAYIPAKDRAEAADLLVGAFYDFGHLDDSANTDHLDSDISEAIKSRTTVEEEDSFIEEDDGYGF